MKWKFFFYVVSLAFIIIPSAPLMAATNTTEVTGSVNLVAYEVSASNISSQGATISWKTNNDATSQVFYDTGPHDNVTGYAYNTSENLSPVQAHNISLTGLAPSATYHYRVRSAATVDGTDFVVISDDYTFTTLATAVVGGGGGGGMPSGGGGTVGEKRITNISSVTTNKLMLIEDVEAPSVDVKAIVFVKKGTVVKNRVNSLLTAIVIEKLVETPDASPNTQIIGGAYDIGPDGAQLDPPAMFTLKYEEDQIPEGIPESNLYIATWNEGNQNWERTNCTVDTGANSISTLLSHFSKYTIMADTRPAVFAVSNLSISPGEVSPGASTTISALVTNNGDLPGSYEVALKINNEIIATEAVNLAGGKSKQVTFTRGIKEAGIYTVAIGDKSVTFEVKMPVPAGAATQPAAPVTEEVVPEEPAVQPQAPVAEEIPTPTPILTPTPEPTEELPSRNAYWWLVAGGIAVLAVVAEIVWLRVRRRRSTGIKQ